MIDNQKLLEVLARVEKKLDLIINHLGISEPPRRTNAELKILAQEKLIWLQKRKKTAKNPDHGYPEKIRH